MQCFYVTAVIVILLLITWFVFAKFKDYENPCLGIFILILSFVMQNIILDKISGYTNYKQDLEILFIGVVACGIVSFIGSVYLIVIWDKLTDDKKVITIVLIGLQVAILNTMLSFNFIPIHFKILLNFGYITVPIFLGYLLGKNKNP